MIWSKLEIRNQHNCAAFSRVGSSQTRLFTEVAITGNIQTEELSFQKVLKILNWLIFADLTAVRTMQYNFMRFLMVTASFMTLTNNITKTTHDREIYHDCKILAETIIFQESPENLKSLNVCSS